MSGGVEIPLELSLAKERRHRLLLSLAEEEDYKSLLAAAEALNELVLALQVANRWLAQEAGEHAAVQIKAEYADAKRLGEELGPTC